MKINHKSDYTTRRRNEYPPVADLADALYWKEKGDVSKWHAYVAKIDVIKQQYPRNSPPAPPSQ